MSALCSHVTKVILHLNSICRANIHYDFGLIYDQNVFLKARIQKDRANKHQVQNTAKYIMLH